MANIGRLGHMVNPTLTTAMTNPGLNFILAWLVILFELLFPILVWWRRLRLVMIGIGIVFHIVIWIFLSLPDFGLIMIVAYSIFLGDGSLGHKDHKGATRNHK